MLVSVFSLFLSFVEKEYQTESKRNKIFAMIFLGPEDTHEAWSVIRLQRIYIFLLFHAIILSVLDV